MVAGRNVEAEERYEYVASNSDLDQDSLEAGRVVYPKS
jgi:hypothetical protein